MGSRTRTPYPPCEDCSCKGDDCIGDAYFPPDLRKFSWPELIGVDAKVAKARIEKENPYVTAVIAHVEIFDICCNRVWIHVDANGKVRYPAPVVG